MTKEYNINDYDVEDFLVEDIDFPKKFNVICLNDDYTSFDFVSEMLMKHFGKTFEESEAIAIEVHKTGQSTIATLPEYVAQEKVRLVHEEARANKFPLKLKLEETK